MRALAFAVAIPLALALPFAPAHAEPGGQAAFFCFWVDAAHKRAATTSLFRAPIDQSDEIASAFAAAMRQDTKARRVYDCAWRRDPVASEQDRQSLRAAHAGKGFSVSDVNWTPSMAVR